MSEVSSPSGRPACPCDSGLTYDACCRPYHRDPGTAPTAEALMRSRYSAFVKGLASYLLHTWHPATRPPSLQLDDRITWTGLEVLAAQDGGAGDRRGMVEFVARYSRDGEPGSLHEISRFRQQGDTWLYVRGRARWGA
ncbi:YchJ family protein [Nocardioides sp. BYT-33-1]|uniref:YchJ family protein n=1 Tax=Nocardioides sp. BYT-33-1 TaxID=3416952 RepID=UPI003F5292D5